VDNIPMLRDLMTSAKLIIPRYLNLKDYEVRFYNKLIKCKLEKERGTSLLG
jgi:hypothetical protein